MRRPETRRLALGYLTLGALLSGCGQRAAGGTTPGGGPAGRLTVAGSSALQPLIDRAGQTYQAAHPGAQVRVAAPPPGSGAGRVGVCTGGLDIGTSDVPLTGQERTSLNCAGAVQTAVALQAFVAVANPAGPGGVRALTRPQLQRLFDGTTRDWSEVGGTSRRVVLVNRLQGSGTRQSMANYLFGGDDARFAVGAAEEENQGVLDAVAQTPGAVSYLGLAYAAHARLVAFGIRDGSSVVTATRDTVASGRWPIGGPGLAITKGPASPLAAAFLTHLLSPEFQRDPIWTDLGFVPPARAAVGNPTGA